MRLGWLGSAALLAAFFGMAGFSGPASAQTGPQGGMESGTDGSSGGPGIRGGGPMFWHHGLEREGWRHRRPGGDGAFFRFRRGAEEIDIRCPEDQPVQACVAAAGMLLDKLASLPRPSGGSGAPGGSSGPATPGGPPGGR